MLRIATDYAAVIEGQKAGNIHIAMHGPSSYVRAWTVTNGGVEAFNTTINSDGSIGYYSVAYARSTDQGARLEDFRGRNLCLVDPNSAFEEAPQKAKPAFDRLSDGRDIGFKRVGHADYEPIVALQKFVDDMRRRRGS